MDKEMLEQFQLIIQEIGGVESRLKQEIRDTETRITLKLRTTFPSVLSHCLTDTSWYMRSNGSWSARQKP